MSLIYSSTSTTLAGARIMKIGTIAKSVATKAHRTYIVATLVRLIQCKRKVGIFPICTSLTRGSKLYLDVSYTKELQ